MEILACFIGFFSGAGLTMFLMRESRQRKPPDVIDTSFPELSKREKVQWDNFLNYNGTEEGQKQLEDE